MTLKVSSAVQLQFGIMKEWIFGSFAVIWGEYSGYEFARTDRRRKPGQDKTWLRLAQWQECLLQKSTKGYLLFAELHAGGSCKCRRKGAAVYHGLQGQHGKSRWHQLSVTV